MFGSFGGMELLVIALVFLLFFGAKRIPELARGIGQGIKEFRKASDEIKKEIEKGEKEDFDKNDSHTPAENQKESET